MIYRRINLLTGLFIEDVITDEPADDLIATPCTIQCYWPKWDFVNKTWIEGGTAPSPTVQPPTTEEVLSDLITVLIDSGVITNV